MPRSPCLPTTSSSCCCCHPNRPPCPYADITPTNDLERTYALASLLIGALVFGYLLSSVGSMMSTLDNRANMVEMKLDMAQEVIRHTNLPSALASRIRSYTEYYYSRQSVYDVQEVLGHLTPALDRQVKEFFLSQSIDMLRLLSRHDTAFKLAVLPKCSPVMFEAHEEFVVKGARTSDVLFLQKGEVCAIMAGVERMVLYEVNPGSSLAECCLLGRASPLSYKSNTRCEFFVLSDADLAETVREHLSPSDKARLAADVVKECCRKQHIRWFGFRFALGKLREAKTGFKTTPKTQAALIIQSAWVRRSEQPALYSIPRCFAHWGEMPKGDTRASSAASPLLGGGTRFPADRPLEKGRFMPATAPGPAKAWAPNQKGMMVPVGGNATAAGGERAAASNPMRPKLPVPVPVPLGGGAAAAPMPASGQPSWRRRARNSLPSWPPSDRSTNGDSGKVVSELLEEIRASRDEMRKANAQLNSRLERVENALRVDTPSMATDAEASAVGGTRRPSKERMLDA